MCTVSINNQLSNVHEPFIDDEGNTVWVVEEFADGRVLFSDGGMFYPMPQDKLPMVAEPKEWLLTKTCRNCEEELNREMFHADMKSADGLHSHCKACRSKAKAPTEERYFEPRIWIEEAQRVCPCVVCGDAPVLPETAEEARVYLRAHAPLCSAHSGAQSLKARLKMKRWTDHAEQKLLTIDVYHDLTVKLKNIPRERAKTKGSQKWLAGDRMDISADVHNKLVELFERRVGAKYIKSLPKVLTEYQNNNIKRLESTASKLIGDKNLSEDDLFSHIVDNRELSRQITEGIVEARRVESV